MTLAIFLTAALAAEPAGDQLKLLETFRNEFIAITPGDGDGTFPQTLTMGREAGGEDSARPVHKVTFSYNFHIAKYEIPQDLWQAVMGENPSKWKGPRNSVEMLSLDEAQQFCQRATELMRVAKLIRPNQIIRLPSESEWEYVARAGTTTLFSFGDDVDQIDDYAWHTDNAAGNDPPVGVKKPNPWGLFDVHGYLWEWCADAWHDTYEGAPADGSVRVSAGEARQGVLRGGSWKDPADNLNCSYRREAPRNLRDDAVGLRCVLAEVK